MYLSRRNGACAYTLLSGYNGRSNSTEMVKTCCVYKFRYVFNADARSRGVSFPRFSKDKRKRRVWVKPVDRDKWEPGNHSWICSDHFLHGWHGEDPSDDNNGPTLFQYKREITSLQFSLHAHGSYCRAEEASDDNDEDLCAITTDTTDDVNIHLTCDSGMQCEDDPLYVKNRELTQEISRLREELGRHKWGVELIRDNDGMTKFYTGLPSFAIFLWLYLAPKCSRITYWRGQGETTASDRVMRISFLLTMSTGPKK
uniref:THAP-type domain-containing protein n=1 Tax=Magallana gigas TaxID=29159 RepID=A0A8W8KLD3_MAGGI